MTKLKLSRDVMEESNESMEEAKADRHSDPEFYPNSTRYTVLSSAVKRQLSKFKQAVGRFRANFPAFAASFTG